MSHLLNRKTLTTILFTSLTLLLFAFPQGLVAPVLADSSPPTPVWDSLPPYVSGAIPPRVLAASGQGTLKTFSAAADAEIKQADPDGNYGIAPTMGAGYHNYLSGQEPITLIRRSLLRFDVSSRLPSGTVVHKATLRLFTSAYCDAQSTQYRINRVVDDWSEMAVTWNNQPAFAEEHGITTIPTAFGWVEFNISELVQAWINGEYDENGLMVRGPEAPPYACAYRNFYTKGGGGYTEAPELVIDYTMPVATFTPSKTALLFQRGCGEAAPPSQTFSLHTNQNFLNGWITSAIQEDWFSLSKTSGQVSYIFPDEISVTVNDTLPCPGKATGEFQIDIPTLAGSTQTVSVTLQHIAQLTVNIPADKLAFTHRCGEPLPPAQTIEISSDADIPVDWTATLKSGGGWLQLSKNSGQVLDGSPDEIEVSVVESEPCSDRLTAEIEISAANLVGSPKTIAVTLEQTPRATLTIPTDEITFLHQCGTELPTAQTIEIQSDADTPRNWTASVSGGENWLHLDKRSGQVSNGLPDQIELSVAEATPCPGTVTAEIQIDATSLDGSPHTITVKLEQAEQPVLGVSVEEVTFTHYCGMAPPQSKAVKIQSNVKAFTNWSATLSEGDPWLKVSKTSGQVSSSAPDEIELSIVETETCPGKVTGSIQIVMTESEAGPKTISVTLNQVLPPVSISTNQLTFSHVCGAAVPRAKLVTIMGSEALTTTTTWSAKVIGNDSNWLGLDKGSGQISGNSPDTLHISVSETEPCPGAGTFTETVQIELPQFNIAQQINITLTQQDDHKIFLPTIVKDSGLDNTVNASMLVYDRIMLIVGVADYQYLAPPSTFTILRSGVWGDDLLLPHSDTYAMAKLLENDCSTGVQSAGLACQIIQIVLPEELATKENIDYALQWIDEREDVNTEVIIYFSGHGGPIQDVSLDPEPDGLSELLGVYDTNDTPQFVNHILDDSFEAQLGNLETEHLVVIIDACNSGGMQVSNPFRAVLTASQENQNSWETSEFEHGVFTYFMLQAIQNAASDTNGDGWLSVQEIYDYAYPLVADYVSRNTSKEQHLALDLTRDVNLVRLPQMGVNQ